MKYNNVKLGRFISRPNRFIAKVEIDGKEHTVHVKNTGRCKELLVPNASVYLEKAQNPNRKTEYDLIAVEKFRDSLPPLLINMDSQVVNDVAEEWLKSKEIFGSNATIKREVTKGASRFDFYIEAENRKIFLEVKGVTLENNQVASFPDAPTLRGVKHINELITLRNSGYESYILFVIQLQGVTHFSPNDKTHLEFGEALRNAHKNGVKILAIDCIVTPDEININNPVEIKL